MAIGLPLPVTVHAVRFPSMVWVDDAEQAEAVRQVVGFAVDRVILVGFSKSAPGALRVALRIPDLLTALPA